MGCGCSKPKCDKDDKCGISPAVLQINNPSECVIFHKTIIPASMGNEITIPPKNGAYRNMLVYYESSGSVYVYDSDGIPTLISYTDYLRLLNKPSINGVTLVGDKSLAEIGVNDATLTVKQGGTTLGTFSANASEDVEINIPENSNEPVRLRMVWSTSDEYWGDVEKVGRNMYGTVLDYYFVGGVPRDVGNVATYDETDDVYFVNEETLDEIDLEDVYAMLESGTQIILDNVPIGSYVEYDNNGVSTSSYAPAGTDNVTLSGPNKSVYSIEDATITTSAYSGMVLSIAAQSIAAVPLGVIIGKDERMEGGETTSEIFCWVQGVSWKRISA